MDPLVYILAGLAIGAILAWFIRKLVAEKNMVGRTDLEDKRNQLTQAESKLTFLQEKLNDLQQLVTNTELDLKRAVEEKEKNNLLLESSQTSLEKLKKDKKK